MTNSEVAAQFDLVPAWTGATGWTVPGVPSGKGALLPDYPGGSSLAEVTARGSRRERQDTGTKGTQRHYDSEARREMRQRHQAGESPTRIARELKAPLSSVKRVLGHQAGLRGHDYTLRSREGLRWDKCKQRLRAVEGTP